MTSHQYLESLKEQTAGAVNQLVLHPVYKNLNTIEALRLFMQTHVFAVWDFMSLLKSLQRSLTGIEEIWFPKSNPELRYLINEIVLGEESDVSFNGNRISHFELYVESMIQAGANTHSIELFINDLLHHGNFEKAYKLANVTTPVRDFIDFTFGIVKSNKLHLQAAVFTFGREDLIPSLFLSITQGLQVDGEHNLTKFKYYLERHIELDGDLHGHLAIDMVQQICGDSKKLWDEATAAVKQALNLRSALWDQVHKETVYLQ